MSYTKRLDCVEKNLKLEKTKLKSVLIKHGDEVDIVILISADGTPPHQTFKRQPNENTPAFLMRVQETK